MQDRQRRTRTSLAILCRSVPFSTDGECIGRRMPPIGWTSARAQPPVARRPDSKFDRMVKLSFARALAVRIRKQLRREVSAQGEISRAYLQKLLGGKSAISLPMFISLAEHLNIPTADLLAETMVNLERLRKADRESDAPPSE
jgi:hypothetical protein